MHLFATAVPDRDFRVQDDGPTPILRLGVDGRTRHQIVPISSNETEEIEGVHYRYVVDFSRLKLGVDYDIVERGPYIAEWNLDAPQPTEDELVAAWVAYLEAEGNKPSAPPTDAERIAQLQSQNEELKNRLGDVELIMAEILTGGGE
ncbi:XkdW family protein [Paenibacillus filicis]